MPCPYAPQFDHVRADLDPELLQQQLADGAAGDPRHGLPRTRPLEDVARVLTIVLQAAGQVGVPGPGPGDLAPPLGAPPAPGRGVRFPRHHVLPVPPTAA